MTPGIHDGFPASLQLVLESGISAGAIAAILLNLLFNWRSVEDPELEALPSVRPERLSDDVAAFDAPHGAAVAVLTYVDDGGVTVMETVDRHRARLFLAQHRADPGPAPESPG